MRGRCGGLTEALKIYAMASAYDIPCVPHGSSVFSYHLQMANTNSFWGETIMMAPRGDFIAPVPSRCHDAALLRPCPQAAFLETHSLLLSVSLGLCLLLLLLLYPSGLRQPLHERAIARRREDHARGQAGVVSAANLLWRTQPAALCDSLPPPFPPVIAVFRFRGVDLNRDCLNLHRPYPR